jgi:hypothetical protein
MEPFHQYSTSRRSGRIAAILLLLLPTSLFAQVNSDVVFVTDDGPAIVSHSPALDLVPHMTVESWVKPAAPPVSYGAVVWKSYPEGFTFGVVAVPPVTDSVQVGYGCAGEWFNGPMIPADNVTWTHIALSVDSVAREAVFYMNGMPSDTVTGVIVKLRNTSGDMYLGDSPDGDHLSGALNELRIWNVVRSSSEIGGLWNREAKGNEPGLIAAYHFGDTRDTVAWNRAATEGLDGHFAGGSHFFAEEWPFAFTDEDEPNDFYVNATLTNYGRVFTDAAVAPGDTDIYKLWTRAGDVFSVQSAAKNPGDPGDLSISVYSVDSVTHITTYYSGYPTLTSAASVPGYRYIRVVNRSDAPCAYTLSTVRRGWELLVDGYEPNNTEAEATPLAWGKVAHATLFPGIDGGVASPDTDCYAFTATAGEIGVFLYSLQGFGCGSGYLTIEGPSGILPKSFPNRNQNVKFESSGTYFARIRPNEATYEYLIAGYKGLEDVRGMLYDPGDYGDAVQLVDGMNNAYDYAYRVFVDHVVFSAQPEYALSEVDGRQFVFGPASYSGLLITRKFFVPPANSGDTLGFMRIQEILTNPTESPITVDVGVWSNFGANPARPIATSSGDTLLAVGDTWLQTDDESPSNGTPSLLHMFDGAGGSDGVDSLSLQDDVLYWEWRGVTVEPGETKIYLYFVAQDSAEVVSQGKIAPFSQSRLPEAALMGLGSDANLVANWPTTAVVSVGGQPEKPLSFALHQNYPNPFNPSTRIAYTVGPACDQHTGLSDVRLTIYDLLGRQAAVLVNEKQSPGSYGVNFDGTRLASGIYLYRLEAGENVQVRKMVLLK